MKELVGVVIRDYLADLSDWPNSLLKYSRVPGRDWWQLLLKWWKSELSVQKSQQLPTHIAVSATPKILDQWLETLLKKAGLSTLPADELHHYFWNCDQAGFCTCKEDPSKTRRKREEFITQVEEVVLIISLCWDAMALICHLLLCINQRTCGVVGCKVDLML